MLKRYRYSVLFLSIVVSIPAVFFIVVSFFNGKIQTFLFGLFILLLSWGMYALLKKEKKYAFGISFAIINIFWWFFLMQAIKRISFLLKNGGMELPNGMGSPLAFLIGMVSELVFFIPLTIVLISGLIYLFKKRKEVKKHG